MKIKNEEHPVRTVRQVNKIVVLRIVASTEPSEPLYFVQTHHLYISMGTFFETTTNFLWLFRNLDTITHTKIDLLMFFLGYQAWKTKKNWRFFQTAWPTASQLSAVHSSVQFLILSIRPGVLTSWSSLVSNLDHVNLQQNWPFQWCVYCCICMQLYLKAALYAYECICFRSIVIDLGMLNLFLLHNNWPGLKVRKARKPKWVITKLFFTNQAK